MAKTLAEYGSALTALVTNMTTDIGVKLNINSKPKAQELIKAYVAYAEPLKGNPDTKKFAQWVAEDGKKLAEGATADDIETAKNYMNNRETAEDGLASFYKDGKLLVEKSGNWLGDNWPLLAAVAAPLLLGNFFELGTIGTILVGVLGLGAAAVFSNENSILAPVGDFIRKNTNNLFGLLPEKGGPGQGQGQGNGTGAPSAPAKLPVLDVEPGMKAALGNADKVAETSIKIGTEDQKIKLLGTTKDGVTTFDRYVLVVGDKTSAPLPLKAGARPTVEIVEGKPVLKMTPEVTGAIQSLATDKDLLKVREEMKAAKKPDAPKPVDSSKLTAPVAPLRAGSTDLMLDNGSIKLKGENVRVALVAKGTSDGKNGEVTFDRFILLDAKGVPTGEPIPLGKTIKRTMSNSSVEPVELTAEERTDMAVKAAAATATPAPTKADATPKYVDMKVLESSPDQLMMEYGTFKAGGKDYKLAVRGKVDYTSDPENPDFVTGATMKEFVVLDSKNKPTGVVIPIKDGIQVMAYGNPPATVGMERDPKVIDEATKAQLAKDLGIAAAQSDFVSGNVSFKQPESQGFTSSTDPDERVDVEFTVASDTNPDVTRTFKGKASRDGSVIEITEVLMVTDPSKPPVAVALKAPVKLEGLGISSDLDGNTTVRVDEVKMKEASKTRGKLNSLLSTFGPSVTVEKAAESGLISPPPGPGKGPSADGGMEGP